jgi:hypothetical protein
MGEGTGHGAVQVQFLGAEKADNEAWGCFDCFLLSSVHTALHNTQAIDGRGEPSPHKSRHPPQFDESDKQDMPPLSCRPPQPANDN